jgi:putative ABC transport system substrate-binding protein
LYRRVEATTPAELDLPRPPPNTPMQSSFLRSSDVEAPRVVALAAQHHLPAIYLSREFNGGLVTYGPDLTDLFRRAGGYVDKILRGTRPSDLPIEQPTKFELVTTAKALGLTVPPSLFVRADEVIEWLFAAVHVSGDGTKPTRRDV